MQSQKKKIQVQKLTIFNERQSINRSKEVVMESQKINSLVDEVLDFLASTPTPEQIVAYQPSKASQGRLRALLNKKHSGGLTPEEQAEFDEFTQINHFMSLLKARARQKLDVA